jgi:hypothetical protein
VIGTVTNAPIPPPLVPDTGHPTATDNGSLLWLYVIAGLLLALYGVWWRWWGRGRSK